MDPTRVLAQLERILTSAVFVDAQRASSFLRFIVERTLDGRTSEIKESIIAIEVLGRSPSFDSKTDPIVRVEAARLRDRLREYYDRHARADDVLSPCQKVRTFRSSSSASPRRRSTTCFGSRYFLLPALISSPSRSHRRPTNRVHGSGEWDSEALGA